MDKYKITDSELESGVVAAPNILNDTPQENKSVFDRLPRLIATKVNGFIDAVISKFTDYYNKTEIDGKENVLNESINTKANADDVYTKAQTYTKEETNVAINEKVNELGAGDMAKAVYDTNGDGVVDKAETAENAENAETSQNVRGYWLSKTDANGNPTDELYAHWYEDSETGEVVGSGDEEESKYTLVHEVTTTETVNAFTYECNATKLYVEVLVNPTGESDSAICVLEADRINLVYFQEATRPNHNRLLRSKIIVENGMVRTEDEDSIDYDGSPNNLSWGNTRTYVMSKGGWFTNEITSLKVWLTANRLFPIGTTFKVYEVK